LLKFGVILAEPLPKVLFPIAPAAHSHEVIRRGRREEDREKYVV